MAKRKPHFKVFHLFTKFDVCVFSNKDDWNLSMDIDNNGNGKIDEENPQGRAGCFMVDGGMCFCMFINIDSFKYRNVIHESVHIVDFLMEHIGINDIEFRAYMVEDLSCRIIEHFRKEIKL